MTTLRSILLGIAMVAAVTVYLLFAPAGQKPADSDAARDLSMAGHAMGVTWTVTLARLPANGTFEDLRGAITRRLDALDAELSHWKPGSAVSRFNRSDSTDWVAVPPDLARVVNEAQEVSRQTHGAFDITVAPLVNLWGFGPSAPPPASTAPASVPVAPSFPAPRIPSDDEIRAARARVGYEKLQVRLEPPALKKSQPDLTIDLGAIGKGYAAGCVAQLLDERGVTDYLVALSGEIRARGASRRGRPWRIGVETPVPDIQRVLLALELPAGMALSTSGDYRNFHDIAGRRYSHELDPRTGRPVAHNLALVSVSVPSSSQADALATALLVLGPDEGPQLARQLDIAALFVVRQQDRFETRMTPGFAGMVRQDAASQPGYGR